MRKQIDIGTCDINQSDIDEVSKSLESRFLSHGDQLCKFEEEIAHRHGYKYGLMVNSGQSALEIALVLAKVKLKKSKLRVVVPSTTYAATLWAVLNTNNEAVFCDVNQEFNIDYWDLADLKDIDVVLAVDLCGKACIIPSEIREKYYIIEDACEACGNTLCNYGDIFCTSFYVSHIITTGSGGMLCLSDKNLYDYAKSYIAHGRVWGGNFLENREEWVDRFRFDKVGVSYRSNNFSAALGLSQLKRIDSIIEKRKLNARELIRLFNSSNILMYNFIVPDEEYWEQSIFQFFPIVIRRESTINREKLLRYLYEKRIDSRLLLNLLDQPIVQRLYRDYDVSCSSSLFYNKNGFIVGCHQNLDLKDMSYIASTIEDYLK